MKHKTFFVNNTSTTQCSRLRLPIFAFTLILLLAAFGLNCPKAQAQTYAEKTLHSFTGGTDGSNTRAGLVNVNGVLYGAIYTGGSAGGGAIYSVNPDGTGYQIVYNFQATSSTDGAFPWATLLLVNGKLYGVTLQGGSNNDGTIYSFDPTTKTETTLYSFGATSSTDGELPQGSLINVNGILYGTTTMGGTTTGGINEGFGTVFSFNLASLTETIIHNFTSSGGDGAYPLAGLLAVNGLLYGTTHGGGALGDGIVFSLDPSSGIELILHTFTANSLNEDGSSPYSGLVLLNNVLYGTTTSGGIDDGSAGYGTVYSLNLNGKQYNEYQVVYEFTSMNGDGSVPVDSLIAVNGLLYGTTTSGGYDGIYGNGTVFSLDPISGEEKTIYEFTDYDNSEHNSDGASPFADLVAINNTLYGTTQYGGSTDDGTIFSLTPIVLPIAHNDACTIKYNTARTNAAPGVLGNDSNGGGTLTAVLVSLVSHGSLSFHSDGSFTYTPNTGYVGTDSFTYQAVNYAGHSNTATVTLTVAPTVPTAKNDACTIAHNKARTNAAPGVLGNDDNGGSPMTAVLVTNVKHGTLTLSSNGGFTYTPNTGYSGTDNFTYKDTTAIGTSNTATVTLTVQ